MNTDREVLKELQRRFDMAEVSFKNLMMDDDITDDQKEIAKRIRNHLKQIFNTTRKSLLDDR